MRALVLAFFLYGCAPLAVIGDKEGPIIERPSLSSLVNLPAPKQKAVISVYKFPDLTGQRKDADNMALFSTAVTHNLTLTVDIKKSN